jgi:hypothetical protein
MLSAPFDAGQCGERGFFPLYWFSDILHAQSSEYPACPEFGIFFLICFFLFSTLGLGQYLFLFYIFLMFFSFFILQIKIAR